MDIQIYGKKSLILDNTLRLFKKNYWYIIEYNIPYLKGSFNFNICLQSYKIEENDIPSFKKILFRINEDEKNYLEIETLSNDTKVIIDKIKCYTLGLMNFGYNNNSEKGTLGNRFILNENLKFSDDPQAEKNIIWDGRVLFLRQPYLHSEIVTSKKTFFRIISPLLNIYDLQQLIAWIKRTYRRNVITNEDIILVLGQENNGNFLIATEDGKILQIENN